MHKFCACFYNKARNSHKPRLGKYVQQGNADRIKDVFRGIPFHVFLGKGVIVKTFLLRGLQKLVFQNIL